LVVAKRQMSPSPPPFPQASYVAPPSASLTPSTNSSTSSTSRGQTQCLDGNCRKAGNSQCTTKRCKKCCVAIGGCRAPGHFTAVANPEPTPPLSSNYASQFLPWSMPTSSPADATLNHAGASSFLASLSTTGTATWEGFAERIATTGTSVFAGGQHPDSTSPTTLGSDDEPHLMPLSTPVTKLASSS
jgi:hypothetical protein